MIKEDYTTQRLIDDEKAKITDEKERKEDKKIILEEKDYLFAQLLERIDTQIFKMRTK